MQFEAKMENCGLLIWLKGSLCSRPSQTPFTSLSTLGFPLHSGSPSPTPHAPVSMTDEFNIPLSTADSPESWLQSAGPLVAWLRPPQSEAGSAMDRQIGLERLVSENSPRASANNPFDEAAIHPVRLSVGFIRTHSFNQTLLHPHHCDLSDCSLSLIALRALMNLPVCDPSMPDSLLF